MTQPGRRAPGRRARARRRRAARAGAWALRLAVVLVAFAVGVAVGRALDDNPDPAREQTYVRTIQPRSISPTPVTVTVTAGSD